MFSILSKVVSTLWNWTLSSEKNLESAENHPEEFLLHNSKKKERERQTFKGNVTRVNDHERYGIINHMIYFSFDNVPGDDELSVGDFVIAHAVRDNTYSAWHAQSVYVPHESWEKCEIEDLKSQSTHFRDLEDLPKIGSESTKKSRTIEGVLTALNHRFCVLDSTFRFSLRDCEVDFKPIVGDWVTVLPGNYPDNAHIIKWQHMEERTVQGIVTACDNDGGIINNEIVFCFSSCHCNSSISIGSEVSAKTVKSNQNVYQWRAIAILPLNSAKGLRNNTKEILINKEGLSVTYPLDFKDVFIGQQKDIIVWLKNESSSNLHLLKCSFHTTHHKCPFSLEKPKLWNPSTKMQIHSAENCEPPNKVIIPPGSSSYVNIICCAQSLGQAEHFLLFEFQDFVIGRNVKANIIDPIDLLNPVVPFTKQSRKIRNQRLNDALVIVPGEKPFRHKKRFCKNLPYYPIPSYLWKVIDEKEEILNVAPWISQNLCINNYVKKFSTLLHLEEMQIHLDMKKYDMSEVCLQRRGEFLNIEIPGLAESRPSLLIGDRALLTPPGCASDFAYEGYIHEVHQSDVLLKFNDSFQNNYNGESYDITFQFNRTNLRRCHQILHDVIKNNSEVIFPMHVKLKEPLIQVLPSRNINISQLNEESLKSVCDKTITWNNKVLNDHQKASVIRILEGRYRPVPYIIFGPPGTGKTVTLVEAIIQIYNANRDARIIVCTPSNSAADLVAERLLESCAVGENDIVRLNSYQRSVEAIPDFIRPFCKDKNNLEVVVNYHIIISTCSTAGSLYSLGLYIGHFTHVFIDEAGQATEPECLIAAGLVASYHNGQIVLAGDPKQLGPVIRSTHAKTYGLETSYLERLMQNCLYKRDENRFAAFRGYNPLLVTMLIQCYRSHPSILHFPSKIFYFSELICCTTEMKEEILNTWKGLPNHGFRIIFHGVKGEEYREENSPSWFNSVEVVQVIKYLQQLYDHGLTPDDIGIITPYRKQELLDSLADKAEEAVRQHNSRELYQIVNVLCGRKRTGIQGLKDKQGEDSVMARWAEHFSDVLNNEVEKIRLLMSSFNLDACKVGSVEEFQGQERMAIIISTVRSCENIIDFDVHHNLGFLSNPKRFNVAVTRAQKLLIVVGNPYILSKDFHWGFFIQYCISNGGYTGCEFSELFSPPDNTEEKIAI